MSYPKTNKAWASHAARMFKTILPNFDGGFGLSENRRFRAAFEGGMPGFEADADQVVQHLIKMVGTDEELAKAVLNHYNTDGSGITALIEPAKAALTQKETGMNTVNFVNKTDIFLGLPAAEVVFDAQDHDYTYGDVTFALIPVEQFRAAVERAREQSQHENWIPSKKRATTASEFDIALGRIDAIGEAPIAGSVFINVAE